MTNFPTFKSCREAYEQGGRDKTIATLEEVLKKYKTSNLYGDRWIEWLEQQLKEAKGEK